MGTLPEKDVSRVSRDMQRNTTSNTGKPEEILTLSPESLRKLKENALIVDETL